MTSFLRFIDSQLRRRRQRTRREGSAHIRGIDILEIRTLLSTLIVDDDLAGFPDGAAVENGVVGTDLFASIQSAIDTAVSGDTIKIQPGDYLENLQISKSLILHGPVGASSDVRVVGTGTGPAISLSGVGSQIELRTLSVETSHVGISIAEGVSAKVENIAIVNSTGPAIHGGNTGDLLLADIDASTGDGLRLSGANDVVIHGGIFRQLTISGANSILLDASDVTSLGPVGLESHNSIELATSINAAEAPVGIRANVDGVGDSGFTMSETARIDTTNETKQAVRISVNTLLGGTGNAALGRIAVGSRGRITVSTGAGAISDINESEPNIVAADAILSAAGGVGSQNNKIDVLVNAIEGTGGAGGFYVDASGPLSIGGVSMVSSGVMSPGGAIEIETHSPLTVSENIVGKSVLLKAGDSPQPGDDLTITTGTIVRAQTGKVAIEAGDDVFIQVDSLVEALAGPVSIEADSNDFDFGVGGVVYLDGVVNAATGTTVVGSADADTFYVTSVGTGGLVLDGSSRDDTFVIQYPDLPKRFHSTISIDDGGGGYDSVIVRGTDAADALFLTTSNPPTQYETEMLTRGDEQTEPIILHDNLEVVRLELGQGVDSAFIQPSIHFPIEVDGGSPCAGDTDHLTGDSLIFDPLDNQFRLEDRTLTTLGLLETYPGVSFTNIENLTAVPLGTGEVQFFDFNHTNTSSSTRTSPTQPGFVSVRSDTLYENGSGFGWREQVASFERNDGFYDGPHAALIQDGQSFGEMATFSIDVPTPGHYLVSLTLGSPYTDVDDVSIRNEETQQVFVENVQTLAGESTNISVPMWTSDGTLDVTFINSRENPTIFGVNGLTVRPANLLTLGIEACEEHALLADGVSIESYPIHGAAPNSLLTASTTLGSIQNADADSELRGIQILTDETGAADVSLRRPFGRGTAVVRLEEVTGAGFGFATIDFVPPQERHFDFNHFNRFSMAVPSPTLLPEVAPQNPSGFIGVLASDLYSSGSGFGWDAEPRSFDNGDVVDELRGRLNRDGAINNDSNTFYAELPNDTYDVTVTMGTITELDGMMLRANGRLVLHGGETAAGEYLQSSFQVDVNEGLLELVVGNSGLIPNWVINGIEIRSATMVTPITFDSGPGPQSADGLSTVSVTALAEVPPGEQVTVSTTRGVITTADANAEQAGIQIEADTTGDVQFEITAPAISGTPRIRITSLDGLHQGEIEDSAFLSWHVPTSRRFDFNHVNNASADSESPNAGGALGVTRRDMDAETVGYGFTSLPNSFDTVSPNDQDQGVPNINLISTMEIHQDYVMGHVATGGRTFRVEVKPDVGYDVRVYVGAMFKDQAARVHVEGVAGYRSVETTAGTYSVLGFLEAYDVDGDGFLNVDLGAGGGISPLWMVNGLDISESATGLSAVVPMRLESNSEPGSAAAVLDPAELASVLDAAVDAWQRTGIDSTAGARLDAVTVSIVDLAGTDIVALAGSREILIDDNAAGFGWNTDLAAVAPDRVDLLTVIAHELGHVIGLPELDPTLHPDDLMSGRLQPGIRSSVSDGINLFYSEAGDLLLPFE